MLQSYTICRSITYEKCHHLNTGGDIERTTDDVGKIEKNTNRASEFWTHGA